MFTKQDFHIHVPAGAIPKDGPSAGITMLTALASLLKGEPVREHLAMTGEITIKGNVLPIGGIKEKVLAAHRSGIKTIILPKRNEKDLVDVPEDVRKELTFHCVEKAEEVLELAFAHAPHKHRANGRHTKGEKEAHEKVAHGKAHDEIAAKGSEADEPHPHASKKSKPGGI
jgi:ATP-dependent Lon protease